MSLEWSPGTRRWLWLLAGAIAAAVSLAGLLHFGPAHEWVSGLSAESAKREFARLGDWGIAASIGLMILHSFLPFPAEVVAVANGMFYGPALGAVITWIGAMLGALTAFGLTRTFGQPFVLAMLAESNRARLDYWVTRHGARLIFSARLVPFIAFNVINYAAGLTGVSWWTFSWSTGLGIVPLTIVCSVAGDQVDKIGAGIWLAFSVGVFGAWIILRQWLARFYGTRS